MLFGKSKFDKAIERFENDPVLVALDLHMDAGRSSTNQDFQHRIGHLPLFTNAEKATLLKQAQRFAPYPTVESQGTQDPTASLHMPKEQQFQTVRGICEKLEELFPEIRAAIHFSEHSRISSCRRHLELDLKSPYRRMLDHFVESFIARTYGKKDKMLKSDADYAHSMLSLGIFVQQHANFARSMRRYSAVGDACMPLEMESIITELVQSLKSVEEFPKGTKTMRIRGLVVAQPSIMCCLPPLAGKNKAYTPGKIDVSCTVHAALSYLGKADEIGSLFSMSLHKWRHEFSDLHYHDTLITLSIFCTIIAGHEYIELANQELMRFLRQQSRETLGKHKSLMDGFSAHAGASVRISSLPSAKSEILNADHTVKDVVKQGAVGIAVTNVIASDSSRSTSIHSQEPKEGWIAPKIAPGTSQTFAGPFGRSEKAMLNHLEDLEQNGKRAATSRSLGPSVYRGAVSDSSSQSSASLAAISGQAEIATPIAGEVIGVVEATTMSTPDKPSPFTIGGITQTVTRMWSPNKSPATTKQITEHAQ